MHWKILLALAVLLVLYLAAGAHLFMYLESNAGDAGPSINIARNFSLSLKDRYPGIGEDVLLEVVGEVLNAFEEGTITINTTREWSTAEAFFFVGTVVTTIGYGNVAPTTTPGRIMTIFYGIIGIPLCLIFLAGLGEKLVHGFKHIEKLFDCCCQDRCTLCCHVVRVTALVLAGWVLFVMIPAIVFAEIEKWTYVESVYYCFVTLSTIGFGDLVTTGGDDDNKNVAYRILTVMWVYVGLAWLSSVISLLSEIMAKGIQKTEEVEAKILEHMQTKLIGTKKSQVGPGVEEGFDELRGEQGTGVKPLKVDESESQTAVSPTYSIDGFKELEETIGL